jgi:predicted GNAT family acetyltransferase
MSLLDRFRAPSPPEFRDDPESGRLEVLVDGRRAGYTAYRRDPGRIAFTHTEIEPEFEGRGLGGALIREALSRARAEGAEVLPYCPFVRSYIERHPDQLDLVPEGRREEFDLAGRDSR